MTATSILALAAAMPEKPFRFVIPGIEPWSWNGRAITTREEHNAAMIDIGHALMVQRVKRSKALMSDGSVAVLSEERWNYE
jgi:presenilin-like A22 family membrane protease